MTPEWCREMAELCSMRLDPKVTAAEFVEHVERLIDSVVDATVTSAEIRDTWPWRDKSKDKRPSQDGGEKPSGKIVVVEADGRPGKRQKHGGRQSPLSYDDRVRIKARHEEALEGRQRVPRGFFPMLAQEFGVPEQAIRNAIYNTDGM